MATKLALIIRTFSEEITKLESVKDELLKKEVTVTDIEISLSQEQERIEGELLKATELGDTEKELALIEEARNFCSATRLAIEELTLIHLGKGYK